MRARTTLDLVRQRRVQRVSDTWYDTTSTWYIYTRTRAAFNCQFVKLSLYFGNCRSACLSVCLSACSLSQTPPARVPSLPVPTGLSRYSPRPQLRLHKKKTSELRTALECISSRATTIRYACGFVVYKKKTSWSGGVDDETLLLV